MQPMLDTQKEQLLKRASRASLATATLLIVVKLIAWGLSGSISVLATFTDSILDAFVSIINLIAISIALKPADEDHHYGHGKAEQLASLAQCGFVGGSGLVLVLHAIDGLRHGSEVESSGAALITMLFSMACTLALVLYQARVVRLTGSLAIHTDSLHYRMDLLTNAGVIAALLAAQRGWSFVDPLVGILIALYMILSILRVAWDAIQMLMDRALGEEKTALIEKQVLSERHIVGMHRLRTRMSGITPVIQLDLGLDGQLSLQEAHGIGKRVEKRLLEVIPDADITIHLAPRQPGSAGINSSTSAKNGSTPAVFCTNEKPT
ncbi:MAG: cation diffusion facilitator family transporter [Kistimonas sp.]|nr:cation diffusion facilitator family transporter [Kistimonas sp.]